jgi:hypothetical protein
MLIEPSHVQFVPIDVTQILVVAITSIAGFATYYFTGRRVGRGEAKMEAVARNVSQHAELATSAAATAERHAATAVQITSMFPRPAVPFGLAAESLPPEALESEPPPTQRTVPRPSPPVDRPTPKDRSGR